MEKTAVNESQRKSIKIFAEYLKNLRAVNLYVDVQSCESCEWDGGNIPVLSVKSNEIVIPKLGNFKLILDELTIQDCCSLSPRALDKNVLCYRLIVKPETNSGSAAAEIISNFEKTLDEGTKNLVRNSINSVALREGTSYLIRCRFCSNLLTDVVKFDRIRPLPSNDWVENAHELWYCHPPEPNAFQVQQQDVSSRLDRIHLSSCNVGTLQQNKSVVELLQCPDSNYCFYGPCNWTLNKDVFKGISMSSPTEDCVAFKAECSHCKNELGSFTSEFCVRIWDYGVVWIEHSNVTDDASAMASQNATERAISNFKSIVFATIYELADHPTFKFTISSTLMGNSVFLWNIDRNLLVYEQKCIPLESTNTSSTFVLKRRKVAKFFFGVKENNVLPDFNARDIVIIQESEQNGHGTLAVPHFVFSAGINDLRNTSILYSRDSQSLQCSYLIYDV